ncbi:PREDICTED: nucleoredoxin-like, partial [Colobus angolensis palliatus]|uniref:nucleoredoxin-like n=1 Tax=Colobus angolensis palliatus TaxID=336983 RepID=UPI0005F4BA1D
LEFPWGPKPFREVIAGPLLRNNGQSLESSSLEGSHVGVYFSAHWHSGWKPRLPPNPWAELSTGGRIWRWCSGDAEPCSPRVSLCRSEESFKQYFSEMPWLAVPYTDEARRSRLNRLYGIQGRCSRPRLPAAPEHLLTWAH